MWSPRPARKICKARAAAGSSALHPLIGPIPITAIRHPDFHFRSRICKIPDMAEVMDGLPADSCTGFPDGECADLTGDEDPLTSHEMPCLAHPSPILAALHPRPLCCGSAHSWVLEERKAGLSTGSLWDFRRPWVLAGLRGRLARLSASARHVDASGRNGADRGVIPCGAFVPDPRRHAVVRRARRW